ncbi:MAG: LLM class flavin-dependent oxidoreductase [Chloroflexi bacterium]|nr:LLM class flavin-dependent oxidoreductase [Chloroflexota bacterium]
MKQPGGIRFGINFVPTVGPEERSAARYFDESLNLAARAEALGLGSARITEHYFYDYGGYCPDPVTFLSALAQRTTRMRLCTAGVTPAFSHPIRIASQLAMLDNLSHGRLDAGFARGFVPHEFDAFGVALEESRSRFEEGVSAITWLWTQPEATWRGRYHAFGPVRLLPLPYQQPHPPIWVVTTFSPELFEWSGRNGYHLMAVPYISTHENTANLVGIYRRAWEAAGHRRGAEQVQLSLHCYIAEDGATARREAKRYYEEYTTKLLQAVGAWSSRRVAAYAGYQNLGRAIEANAYEGVLRETKALIGSPREIVEQVAYLRGWYGDFEASLQFNFASVPDDAAHRSLELLGTAVLPALREQGLTTSLDGSAPPGPNRPRGC